MQAELFTRSALYDAIQCVCKLTIFSHCRMVCKLNRRGGGAWAMEALNHARIMNLERSMLTLVAFFVICSATTAESTGSYPHEQRHFSAEDRGVKKSVPIPKDVLAILSKDETVQSVLEGQNILTQNLPRSWFSASAIHLSRPERVDLVVMGQGPLRGANVITFWIFCATPSGYQLVLSAPAHDLLVKNTRWKT